MKNLLERIWSILKKTGKSIIKDKVMKLSASLAYYNIFSLGPMLIVIIFLSNLFWKEAAVEGQLFFQIKSLVGKDVALQIQEIIKNASISGNRTFTAILGFGTLIIAATTVFIEIQDSIKCFEVKAIVFETDGTISVIGTDSGETSNALKNVKSIEK